MAAIQAIPAIRATQAGLAEMCQIGPRDHTWDEIRKLAEPFI